MPNLTIKNIPEEVFRALRMRAARHSRGVEAEVRAILEEAVDPESLGKLGSLLAQIGRQVKLTNEEAALFNQRNKASDNLPPRYLP